MNTNNHKRKFYQNSGFNARKIYVKPKFGRYKSSDHHAISKASCAIKEDDNSVDKLVTKLTSAITSVLENYRTRNDKSESHVLSSHRERKLYPPCEYCSRTNHASAACYRKPSENNVSLN